MWFAQGSIALVVAHCVRERHRRAEVVAPRARYCVERADRIVRLLTSDLIGGLSLGEQLVLVTARNCVHLVFDRFNGAEELVFGSGGLLCGSCRFSKSGL